MFARRDRFRLLVIWAPVFGVFALVVGFGADLFTWGWPSLREALLLPPLLLVFPAFVEELVFRGLLLPQSLAGESAGKRAVAIVANVALFVVYHPINHWTLSLSETDMFVDPAFLAIVAVLGLACAHMRLRTASIVPAVALHWLTVVVWNLFLGRPR